MKILLDKTKQPLKRERSVSLKMYRKKLYKMKHRVKKTHKNSGAHDSWENIQWSKLHLVAALENIKEIMNKGWLNTSPKLINSINPHI